MRGVFAARQLVVHVVILVFVAFRRSRTDGDTSWREGLPSVFCAPFWTAFSGVLHFVDHGVEANLGLEQVDFYWRDLRIARVLRMLGALEHPIGSMPLASGDVVALSGSHSPLLPPPLYVSTSHVPVVTLIRQALLFQLSRVLYPEDVSGVRRPSRARPHRTRAILALEEGPFVGVVHVRPALRARVRDNENRVAIVDGSGGLVFAIGVRKNGTASDPVLKDERGPFRDGTRSTSPHEVVVVVQVVVCAPVVMCARVGALYDGWRRLLATCALADARTRRRRARSHEGTGDRSRGGGPPACRRL